MTFSYYTVNSLFIIIIMAFKMQININKTQQNIALGWGGAGGNEISKAYS